MSIQDCPTELLGLIVEQIFQFGSGVGDVRSLRAVDRTFCALTTPLVFRRVCVTNSPASAAGLRALVCRRELAKVVETIVFRWRQVEANNTDSETEGRQRTHQALAEVLARLSDFPALSSVEVNLWPGAYAPPLFGNVRGREHLTAEAIALQSAIVEAFSRNTDTPSITSLALENLLAIPCEHYQSAGFAGLLPSLENLRVSVHGTDGVPGVAQAEEKWDRMWQETIPIHLLVPAQARLTSLTLKSVHYMGRSPQPDLSAIFFPALRRLELSGIMFDDQGRTEEFVVRHGLSMVALVLDSCPMHLPSAGHDPTRPWAAVCDRFADRLGVLTSLDVRLRRGWGMSCGGGGAQASTSRLSYESCVVGYGIVRGAVRDAVEVSDRLALERFKSIVNARRDKLREWSDPINVT